MNRTNQLHPVVSLAALLALVSVFVSGAFAQTGCCVDPNDPNWCCLSATDRTAQECANDLPGSMFKAGTCLQGQNPNGVCNGIGPQIQCSTHSATPTLSDAGVGTFAVLMVLVLTANAFLARRRRAPLT